MSDSLNKAVDDLKAKISEHVAALQQDTNWREIQRLYAGLGVLEELCGQSKTEFATLLGISHDDTVKIESWEFAGQPPLDAAKMYLRKIAPKRKAASLDEILTALETGGLKANRDELRMSLSRSTLEVYKVGEDLYGLLEYFPHIKRGGKKKPGVVVSTNGSEQKVEASDAMGETMADGQ